MFLFSRVATALAILGATFLHQKMALAQMGSDEATAGYGPRIEGGYVEFTTVNEVVEEWGNSGDSYYVSIRGFGTLYSGYSVDEKPQEPLYRGILNMELSLNGAHPTEVDEGGEIAMRTPFFFKRVKQSMEQCARLASNAITINPLGSNRILGRPRFYLAADKISISRPPYLHVEDLDTYWCKLKR